MCGRFDRHSELEKFASLVKGLVLDGADGLPPSYNVAPSQDAAVIALDADGARRVNVRNWGLVPAWASKPGLSRPINARVETVAEKPMFRSAFARRRCLVPCDGYYEWTADGKAKRPWYFSRPGGLLIAGIFERNTRLAPRPLDTFCLLTREASDTVRGIHHRMPVLLAGNAAEAWLDPDSPAADLSALAREASEGELSFHPVSTFVNSPANNSPRCLERED